MCGVNVCACMQSFACLRARVCTRKGVHKSVNGNLPTNWNAGWATSITQAPPHRGSYFFLNGNLLISAVCCCACVCVCYRTCLCWRLVRTYPVVGRLVFARFGSATDVRRATKTHVVDFRANVIRWICTRANVTSIHLPVLRPSLRHIFFPYNRHFPQIVRS